MTLVNGIQASTVTKVAFGDWRRFASFMTQIAIQSQTASQTRTKIKQKLPPIPPLYRSSRALHSS
jgi:hypothetical protein